MAGGTLLLFVIFAAASGDLPSGPATLLFYVFAFVPVGFLIVFRQHRVTLDRFDERLRWWLGAVAADGRRDGSGPTTTVACAVAPTAAAGPSP